MNIDAEYTIILSKAEFEALVALCTSHADLINMEEYEGEDDGEGENLNTVMRTCGLKRKMYRPFPQRISEIRDKIMGLRNK